MLLTTILADLEYESNRPLDGISVDDIVYDSRKAVAGTMFVCLVGAVADGHNYASGAFENGCRVFLVERFLELSDDCVQVKIDDTRSGLALASAAFFGYPARSLAIIGITGTKGKTTVASLASAILNAGGINTATIGTTGIVINGVRTPTHHTTPESYELHKAFRRMVDSGVACVVMEVSSQSVYMRRIAGISFHIGVFTNLSPDHIGGVEHPTFEHYMACKAELFKLCRYGIFNADDPHYIDMVRASKSINTTFGFEGQRDLLASHVRPLKRGSTLGVGFECRSVFGEGEYTLSMPGDFNVGNALAAIAVAQRMQIPDGIIRASLSTATVRGRFEPVESPTGAMREVTAIIDYAHNAVSMKAALETIRRYEPKRLVVLFGSVGGRTQLRRGELGEVAAKYADFVIITSDNPNFEPPEEIIRDIEASVASTSCPYVTITDRRDAVRYAIDHALSGDCILFAGKGHEDYQLIDGEYRHYDEREEILAAIAEREKLSAEAGL